MLEILLNNTPNNVNKGNKLIQALIKKGFELFPSDGNIGFILHLLLMLLPAKQDGIFEETGCKWHTILTFGPNNGKIVFTLLEKVITLQVSFILIYVWELGL